MVDSFDKKLMGKLTRTEAFETFMRMVVAGALMVDVDYKIEKKPNQVGVA